MACCQDKACELEALQKRQSGTLWAVLGINGAMFGLELTLGLLAGSLALLADSLDMLGDTLVYGFSLYVVSRNARWRARAALLKGVIMAVFGLAVLAQAAYKLAVPTLPDAQLMGWVGLTTLLANALCLVLLTRHRRDDLNMRSTWLCSRNDIVANLGVLAASVSVSFTRSMWPDLVVSGLITAVFMRSSVHVLKGAVEELRSRCREGLCPADACVCGMA